MKSLSTTLNNLNKVLSNISTTRSKRKKSNKKRTNYRPSRINRALPAAYASHVRSRFSILSRNYNACVIRGCDLVYSIPATLDESGDTIFTIITANPCYWSGTRIARIAPAYQNYRPVSFKCSYIPQVAVTQSGTVFMGTLWDEASPTDNIQQSLVTSNGGQLTQCYIPADSNIRLGSNLQQNLFKTTGSLSTETNPFTFLAGVRGASVIPGYFYVSYTYELKNPIGDAWTFINSGITTLAALPVQQPSANGTIILLNQNGSLGPGTQIDRESDGYRYHGSPIELQEQTRVVYLNNFQTATQTTALMSVERPSILLSSYRVSSSTNLFRDMSTGSGSVTPSSSQLLMLIKDTASYYEITFKANTFNVTSQYHYALIPRYANVYINDESGNSVLQYNTDGVNESYDDINYVSNSTFLFNFAN